MHRHSRSESVPFDSFGAGEGDADRPGARSPSGAARGHCSGAAVWALARRGFCAAAGILLAFAALCAVSMQAQAQTTLVSNIGESLQSGTSGVIQAQQFTTGGHADGYTISEVRIRLASWTGSRTTSVKIRTNSRGLPGDLVAELMNPSPLAKDSVNSFTAPAGTMLDRNRRYWIVVNEGIGSSQRVSFRRTHSNDQTGEAGWSIANTLRWKTTDSGTWATDNNPRLSMEIKGSAAVVDATLGSPEFFVQEHADYYADLTYRFDLTLTEAVSTPHGDIRDHAFEVTNGRMVKAKRIGGDSAHWRMTVLPIEDREPVTVRLRGNRPCSERGALCTGGGGRITNSPELTLHYETLTMNTAMLPSVSIENTTARENDAYLAFDVRLSKPARQTIAVDFETVSGGTATEGADYWRSRHRILFRPGESEKPAAVALIADTVSDDGETVMGEISNARVIAAAGPEFGGVTITNAQATGTINAAATTTTAVPDVDIRILDTTGNEGDGGMDFPVRLSRGLSDYVCYDFETLTTGTADLGDDYLARPKSTQWMWPRTTEQDQFVWMVDDNINDNGETVKVKISNARLCNDASRTITIARGEATGTIYNSDPLPRAWIARFGRTVADQVLDAVEARLRAARSAGVEIGVGGQRIGVASPAAGSRSGENSSGVENPGSSAASASPFGGAAEAEEAARLVAMAEWLNGETPEKDASHPGSWSMTPRELLLGSSFSLAAETDGGGFAGLWGRMVQTRFAGREGTLSLDGDVTTALLGADYAWDRWTTGLVLSHSTGEGSHRGGSSGEIEAGVTAVTPWAGYALTENLSVWGAAGYGAGELTLTQADGTALKTDLGMTLAAAGARGTLVGGDGPGLDAVADARWVRTTTARVSSSAGNLTAAQASVTRLRLGLEGSWPLALGDGATMTPRLGLGVRQDGGDAETGHGVDISGGVELASPAQGLTVSLDGRGMLTHEAADLRDRGIAGTLAWNPPPSNGRGPMLTLSQTFGTGGSSGRDALLARGTLAGLAANDDSDDLRRRRLEARFGYGSTMFGNRFTGTLEIGLGLSEAGRDYSLGWRLTRAGAGPGSLEFLLEAHRRESANGTTHSEHGIGFRLTAGF